MQIVMIQKNKLYKYPFPNENITTYWLKDIDTYGNERSLISLERKDSDWHLISNSTCIIEINGNKVNEISLNLNDFIKVFINDNNNQSYALIYICEENDISYSSYEVLEDGIYTIGKSNSQNIILESNYISEEHATIVKKDHRYLIKSKDINSFVYVNNNRVNSKVLKNGDTIFIYGFKIIVLNDYLIINNWKNSLKINTSSIIAKPLPEYTSPLLPAEEDDNATLYNENDYYSRSPRFLTTIVEEELKIDSPPGKIEIDETPVLYTIGPMLTMSMSSVVSATVSVMNLKNGSGSIMSSLPAIIVSVTMLTSTLLWPTLMKKYNNKRIKKKEQERQQKYIDYLNEKRAYIDNLRVNQLQVLNENYKEPSELLIVIVNKKRNLWERIIDSEDFLQVRLGLGTIPLKIKLSYSLEDFTMVEDNLKDELKKIVDSSKDISNAPITISLTERNKLALIGEDYYRKSMLKSIILQLATYHSYDELKLVFMIDDNIDEIWDSVKILPHTWSNTRDIRFFATNYDDKSKISFYLEQVYTARKYTEENGKRTSSNLTYRDVSPYYLIVIDNVKKNRNIEIINKVLTEERNLGFGLIILNDGIANLPNECNDFLTVDGEKSAIIKNDLNSNNQQLFIMDNMDDIDLPYLCERLSNIPIKLPLMLDEMKSSLGFLEMYKVGKVEQLNILERWTTNNPVNSLGVPIGIHTDGELFNLDLHEKFHGPHGLIAGMTGSGKSELIITFILSMCLNFNPEEVSFVLIDYKGGGLTGAFENREIGIRLPHLAGTITNLDAAEIKRSLSSIKSELKRRQALFNQAKIKLNESTLDIYKYQKLYRDGLLEVPISHLFIITDEFAELKSQQPEFMDELISTARIGRSLGVHLILATQKPSGIVDDQIWSNSKFKVCLKVQEKSDSMDVIKCPDAAALKKVGRFYLQVGYNDYFAMGQAAYAGTKYIPRDKIVKSVDRNISFINNIGDTIKSIETTKREEVKSIGEELPNILKYIYNVAKDKHLFANKLWLDKIPEKIYINNLINKYSFIPKKWDISAIIGEYDDPENQRQDLLTLDMNDSGNTLIYGVSGKDIILSSIIYSLIITHNSEELNIYILDFGSGIFGIFKSAPQIGDVIFLNETEKIANFFNVITKELELRKKLFVDYNGDYNIYIKNSGKTIPRYIIVINNYESLNENYEEYIDDIASISRESEKYGISFIITASGVNAVRGKTAQNFNKQLCLQFNDPSDYTSILGSTRGLTPMNVVGRGLVKIDGRLLEFQTAYPYIWEEINSFIKNICDRLNQTIKIKAAKIKILPTNVRMCDISSEITTLQSVPIGIRKDNLEVSTFNFARNPISLVSAQDITILDQFIPSLAEVIGSINNVNLYLIDALGSIKDKTKFTNYYSTDCIEAYNKLIEISNSTPTLNSIFLIFGFDTFKNALPANDQTRLKQILNNLKASSQVKVIMVDAVSKLKTYEYDEFYRNNIQPNNAIWVGTGLTEQFTIKSSTYNKETRSPIDNNFGYNIDRGKAELIKVIDFYTKE